MSEIDRICQQVKQAFEGQAWHGPSVLETLDGISASMAAAKPISEMHSIWEIVLHLAATQKLMLRRLQGNATELTPDEDWPPDPKPTEEVWRNAIENLKRGEAELQKAVAAFPDDRLNQPLIAGGSSAYNNFHGYVQHNLYHAGQIGLLKKVVGHVSTQRS